MQLTSDNHELVKDKGKSNRRVYLYQKRQNAGGTQLLRINEQGVRFLKRLYMRTELWETLFVLAVA